MKCLRLEVEIERKSDRMPAFLVVPAVAVAPWKLRGTTTVDARLDGVALGRRSLIRWDADRWFVELRQGQLQAVGKGPGERAVLEIARASTALPEELAALIESSPRARVCWEAKTASQRRMLREHVLAAKRPATRERRARRALLAAPEPPPRIEGLGREPRALRVRILGRRLPGPSWGSYSEVTVGLVRRTGCGPEGGVSAGARKAEWETRVEVRKAAGRPAFRGPAVNGTPRQRFLYLTWVGREKGAAPAMFRRAKLRLDAIPEGALADALRSGELVARLELTASDGSPVCGSLRPPAIDWAGS